MANLFSLLTPVQWQANQLQPSKNKEYNPVLQKWPIKMLQDYFYFVLKFLFSTWWCSGSRIATPLVSPPYSAAKFKQCTKHNIKLINYNISCCHLIGVCRSFGTADGLMAENGEPLTLEDLTSEKTQHILSASLHACIHTHTHIHTLAAGIQHILIPYNHRIQSKLTCAHSPRHTPNIGTKVSISFLS